VATTTSLAGLPLSAAIAMPRLRWAPVDAPDLTATNPETWRKLRGPGAAVGGPDVAVPTIDAAGRWVLYGLVSGKPVPGLPAAEPAPLEPGAPRLCRIEGDTCRPWPVSWPDPARPLAQADLSWSPAGGHPFGGGALGLDDALAYDVETGLYLRHIEPAPLRAPASGRLLDGPHIELTGRVDAEEPHEGPSVLFVLRKVAGGRLTEVRMAATPAPRGAQGHVFQLQRASASLTAGPRTYAYAVRPVLALTSLSLPLGGVVLLLGWLLRRRRGEAAPWITPAVEAAAALAAGIAAAGPAVVAIASLWGSR
jgi:hypothetical protein